MVVVDSIAVTLNQTGVTTGQAGVTLSTTGKGAVPVVLEWFTSDSPRLLGASDGRDTVSAQGSFTRAHAFTGAGCYWHVRATAGGKSATSAPVWIRRCQIR
ncbi:hypothetical protein EF918_35160 [Streptomyces sp. WAC06614]|nr:hypothetical protein EF918_35160 [Streptomyces sp. WAC06614]